MAPAPLYLLSGLGADARLFAYLQLHHPSPRVIEWIRPTRQDTMATYAQRLLDQITPHELPPVLVGLSFGGMVAQEIAKLIPVQRVLLISSLASTHDLPGYYRALGSLGLQNWLPFGWFKGWVGPAAWFMGAHTPAEKQLLKSILRDTDVYFLRWALNQILRWRHPEPLPHTVMLHGSADKVLPLRPRPQTQVLPGGEHLMVLHQAPAVSAFINQYL